MQHFSEMLGIQHLDMMHLRVRATLKAVLKNNCNDESEQEPTEGKRRSGEEDESDTTGLGMEMARRRPMNASRANKPTEEVEACRTRRVEEREQGVKPREAKGKNRLNKENLKLSLRGSVERASST